MAMGSKSDMKMSMMIVLMMTGRNSDMEMSMMIGIKMSLTE